MIFSEGPFTQTVDLDFQGIHRHILNRTLGILPFLGHAWITIHYLKMDEPNNTRDNAGIEGWSTRLFQNICL